MIYVDSLKEVSIIGAAFPSDYSCHLLSDESTFELHQFARKIGLKLEWYQDKRIPHYDLTPSKRKLAVLAGAVELSNNSFRQKLRAGDFNILSGPDERLSRA